MIYAGYRDTIVAIITIPKPAPFLWVLPESLGMVDSPVHNTVTWGSWSPMRTWDPNMEIKEMCDIINQDRYRSCPSSNCLRLLRLFWPKNIGHKGPSYQYDRICKGRKFRCKRIYNQKSLKPANKPKTWIVQDLPIFCGWYTTRFPVCVSDRGKICRAPHVAWRGSGGSARLFFTGDGAQEPRWRDDAMASGNRGDPKSWWRITPIFDDNFLWLNKEVLNQIMTFLGFRGRYTVIYRNDCKGQWIHHDNCNDSVNWVDFTRMMISHMDTRVSVTPLGVARVWTHQKKSSLQEWKLSVQTSWLTGHVTGLNLVCLSSNLVAGQDQRWTGKIGWNWHLRACIWCSFRRPVSFYPVFTWFCKIHPRSPPFSQCL